MQLRKNLTSMENWSRKCGFQINVLMVLSRTPFFSFDGSITRGESLDRLVVRLVQVIRQCAQIHASDT